MTAPAGYDFFACSLHEPRDEGLLAVAPAGNADDETEIVRWSSACGSRVVRWIAASRGGPPEIPAAASLTGNYVLLGSVIGGTFPLPCTGSDLWVMQGEYEYALRKPRAVDSALLLGTMPPSINALGDAQIHDVPAAQFLQGLLDNQQPLRSQATTEPWKVVPGTLPNIGNQPNIIESP